MKSSYEVRARHFAHQIYPFIHNCRTPEQYESAVNTFNEEKHRKVYVAYGQTRVALITSDYVLKIDYGRKSAIFGGCEDEYRAYQKVRRDGYSHLFAKISPVMVNEVVMYIMPRVDKIGARYNGWDEAWEASDISCDETDYLNDNFFDLHYNNYGRLHGKLVIVDYAFSAEVYAERHAY